MNFLDNLMYQVRYSNKARRKTDPSGVVNMTMRIFALAFTLAQWE